MNEDADCICAEIAAEAGSRLTDARIKNICDMHTAALDYARTQARADAAEKAWDESHEAACMYPYHFPEICAQNPYRAVASHQEGGA